MAIPADQELVARDRLLPELGHVLDEAWIANRLSECCSIDVRAVHLLYVRYKAGVSCLVSGEVVLGRVSHPFHVVTFGSNHDKLDGLTERGGVRLSTSSIAFRFPFDPELPSLPELIDPERQAETVCRVVEGLPHGHRTSLSRLAYKPQRRCVLRVDCDGRPVASLKVYEADRYERARRNSKLVVADGEVRTAKRLGRAGSKGVIAFEWLAGRVWVDELDLGRDTAANARQVGAAMAQFHRIGASQQHRAAPHDGTDLDGYARNLSALGGGLDEFIQPIMTAVMAPLPDEGIKTLCHGDFYPKQVVLLDAGGVGLIDMDDARIGYAEEDIGNCIAHLHRMELAGRISLQTANSVTQALLEGYARHSNELRPARLKRSTAVSLFRLAMQPFRDRDLNWPAETRRILVRVAEILTGAYE